MIRPRSLPPGSKGRSTVDPVRRICSQWGTALLLAVCLVAFFLDWHVVHETNALEGFSLFGPSTPAPPLHDTGVYFICTGYSHYGDSLVIPGLLGALLLFTVLTRDKRGLLVFAAQVVTSAAILGHAISSRPLAHMFDRVEARLPENVFFLALLASLAASMLRALYRGFILLRHRSAARS